MAFLKSLRAPALILATIIACVVVCTTAVEQPCNCQPGEFRYEKDTVLPDRTEPTVKGLKCNCSSRNLANFPLIDKIDQVVYLDLSDNNLTSTSGRNLPKFISL